ncbi:phage holin family protein [Oryzihumus leptocrescens]|uniref:Putative superfamily III holin-X n=1 Tax=Oryzihumus leptocrescens TaxID=297536 RepID=A0A542Z8P0_9MICO|nr:phage holin family protein [Oryzihumus leptocrescens]TQL56718.1 putative superfamily III holin-X [Oryzihumus leptocrescens]
MAETDAIVHDDASVAELLTRLSEQSTRLVRDELELAKVEITSKARHAGVGAGMFGAAGVLAWFGLGALIATAILALSLVLPAWLAALVVTVVVFAAAGVAALLGRRQVQEAAPPMPRETIDSVERDVAEVKEASHHGRHTV